MIQWTINEAACLELLHKTRAALMRIRMELLDFMRHVVQKLWRRPHFLVQSILIWYQSRRLLTQRGVNLTAVKAAITLCLPLNWHYHLHWALGWWCKALWRAIKVHFSLLLESQFSRDSAEPHRDTQVMLNPHLTSRAGNKSKTLKEIDENGAISNKSPAQLWPILCYLVSYYLILAHFILYVTNMLHLSYFLAN